MLDGKQKWPDTQDAYWKYTQIGLRITQHQTMLKLWWNKLERLK